MDLAQSIVLAELSFTATLFKRQQQVGGHTWELISGKIVPASLDKTCDALEAAGLIVRKPGSREEWVRWQDLSA